MQGVKIPYLEMRLMQREDDQSDDARQDTVAELLREIALAYLEDLPRGRVTLSVEEFATLIGVSRSLAYEAARKGEIPVKRVGRRMVVPVPMILIWLGLE